jgi:hypothetical protein
LANGDDIGGSRLSGSGSSSIQLHAEGGLAKTVRLDQEDRHRELILAALMGGERQRQDLGARRIPTLKIGCDISDTCPVVGDQGLVRSVNVAAVK